MLSAELTHLRTWLDLVSRRQTERALFGVVISVSVLAHETSKERHWRCCLRTWLPWLDWSTQRNKAQQGLRRTSLLFKRSCCVCGRMSSWASNLTETTLWSWFLLDLALPIKRGSLNTRLHITETASSSTVLQLSSWNPCIIKVKEYKN